MGSRRAANVLVLARAKWSPLEVAADDTVATMLATCGDHLQALCVSASLPVLSGREQRQVLLARHPSLGGQVAVRTGSAAPLSRLLEGEFGA